jgi:hydrogenase nickel incorporation protein HypA/HybF
MHEYSIIHALVEQVRTHVEAGQVRHVRIEIGALSGVDPYLLTTAFEVGRFGTVCADATLEITRVDAQWACPRCDRLVGRGARLQCPDCDLPVVMTRGDEIVLAQIQLEMDEERS